MSNKSMFNFSSGQASQKPVQGGVVGDPFKVPMPTFWAVEEPHVVNDAIPRDIRANSTKQNGRAEPTQAALRLFDSSEAAIRYAQTLNRPLVILEINTVNKIIPQLPSVVKYQPPKQEAVVKIDDTAVAFTKASS